MRCARSVALTPLRIRRIFRSIPFTQRTLQRGVYVVNTLQHRISGSRNVRANVPAVAKSDEARGPVATWMRRERMARGWTTHDVVKELAKRGHAITEPSYRGYEAGPRVSAPIRTALEAVFGSKAPDMKNEATEPPQLDSLVSALAAQTAAISRLADALSAQVTPTPALLESLSPGELLQWQARIAKRLAAPPTRSSAESDDPPDREGQGVEAQGAPELS